jgi:cytidylate kinase
MIHKTSSDRLAEAMERARRHWRMTTPAADAAPAPIRTAPVHPISIALSREAGANGSLIARAVAGRLGWPVYDRELLEHIAKEMGLRTELLESVDEKSSHWLRTCFEGLSLQPGVAESSYVRQLVQTMLSLSAHGACVIVGRGAAQVLPSETTLRVRLVAPVADRIEVIGKGRGLSREEAARWVEKTDRDRIVFVWDHFHKDSTSATQYDLTLNTSRLSVEACVELIVEALTRMEPQAEARTAAPATLLVGAPA